MKSGWEIKPLEDLCEFHNGLWAGKKPPFKVASVIRNTNFRSNGRLDLTDVAVLDVEERQLEKRSLKRGDIIIEKSGGGPNQPVGRVVLFDLVDEGFSCSNFTSVIRLKNHSALDFEYLHKQLNWWYCSGVTEPLQRRSTGIRNLDFSAYKRLEVLVPPLNEQRRIVAVLNDVFEGLDRASANAAANLQHARELFETSLENELAASHETISSLGAHVDLLSGFAFKSNVYTDNPSDVRLMRGDNIVPGGVRWRGVKYWPRNEFLKYERYTLRTNDVLIAMDRTWIKSGIKFTVLSDADVPSLLVQRVSRLRSLPTLDTNFLAVLIGSKAFERYVLSIQTGIGVPHISADQIRGFTFPLPSIERQKEIVEKLDQVKSASVSLEIHYSALVNDLEQLRQSLLHKAFAGELT